MSQFKTFTVAVQNQFDKMVKTDILFRSKMTGKEVWNLYLEAYDGDVKFRDPESSTHNCNNCKNFIRRYGNIVAISESGEIMTLFSNLNVAEPYKMVADTLDIKLKTITIENVFVETYDELNSLPYEKCSKKQKIFQLGIQKNLKQYTSAEVDVYGVVNSSEIYEFNHFNLKIPTKFIDKSGKSDATIMNDYRQKYNLFSRAMEEIPLDVYKTVKELISQKSILDGTAFTDIIELMIQFKTDYDNSTFNKNFWCWLTSYSINPGVATFKNNLIGQFCVEIASGMSLNNACENWNKRIDPVNYKKIKSPITEKQKKEAFAFVKENGYLESFNRRLATIDDIVASEIKHINSGDGELKEVSIFDNVKVTKRQSVSNTIKASDNIQEINIDKFMSDILPKYSNFEVLFENKHENNLAVLTTTIQENIKQIFKWNNQYSWTFNGNLAGKSQIKDAVKKQGGAIDGVLRFSIMWAEDDASDNSDLDAWASEPNMDSVGFSTYRKPRISKLGGQLDVDIQTPNSKRNKNIVENITWADLGKMKDGVYKFWVNQYAERGSKGFKAEIEYNGQIFSYEYNKRLSQHKNVNVAKVTLKNGSFSIEHSLPSSESSRNIWNLDTNEFHKVNLVCLSPNHWGENNVGNKFYFFMLDGCKTSEPVRSFHNDNLIGDLMKHRKVMDVLGASNMLEATDNQLAGLGFNSTVNDELVVKCSGENKSKILKIKF